MEVCKLLLKSAKDKNPRDDSGLTPLHMAANKGYLEICKLLMKGLSNKNPVSDDGQHTPLHLALAHSGDLDTVKLLLQNSEDVKSLVNAANKNQQTPLHIAAQHGKNSVIKVLLDNSSCISAVDNDKNTPLHLALAYRGDLDTVMLFLQHSENVKITKYCTHTSNTHMLK